jgi:single-strand DNA-binding protein
MNTIKCIYKKIILLYEVSILYQQYVAIGRLTKDPLIKYTQTGTAVLNFILAVNRPYGNEADYIPCVAWKDEAKKISELGKGSLIRLDGVFKSKVMETDHGNKDFKIQLEVNSSTTIEKRSFSTSENQED